MYKTKTPALTMQELKEIEDLLNYRRQHRRKLKLREEVAVTA